MGPYERTDADFAGSAPLDTITKNDWSLGAGAYIELVFEEHDTQTVTGIDLVGAQRRNRIKVRLTWKKENNEVVSIRICRYKHYKNDGWVEQAQLDINDTSFSYIADFLKIISEHDLLSESRKKIKIGESANLPVSDTEQQKLRDFLLRDEGRTLISELIDTGGLKSGDIVNVGYRRNQLDLFRNMLSDVSELFKFGSEIGLSDCQEETIWQRFFEKNTWIFGYSLSYKFQGLLQSQPHLSGGRIDGKNPVIGDYLLADKRFVSFVEIKKSSTRLFRNSQNRSKAWGLSHELFDSVSQILAQKAAGMHRFKQDDLFDSSGNKITQQPFDPRVVLIIGNWSEISDETDANRAMMLETFELFRRDSRNVEIITFDEIFERAEFIVQNSPSLK